ncbi:MAG TPA: SDR family oxidoreductase [Steroidobacteraceae bacterium]|nr:SDR family oxidoreductase [Steroidobacteraceae bacterium]
MTSTVQDLFNLSGRCALVTGGSRGLGLQMAQSLGEAGAKLALVARNVGELQQAREHLHGLGLHAQIFPADLSHREAIAPLVQSVQAALGRIDILLNNAGATWGAPAEDYPDEAWDKVMRLNVDAVFVLSREVGKRCMIAQGRGSIVNIASVAGLRGNPLAMRTIAYNTSKGAVINFTRALAAEWGQYGIRVNAILPGFFPSKMTAGLLAKMRDQVIQKTPLARIGGEQDLMGAAVFFASDASRHVTGQCLAVDGGASSI